MECLRGGWDLIKDQYWLFLGMTFVAIFIGSAVPMGILLGPMMCGLYLALLRRQRGEPVQFDTLFKGFDYFKDGLIAALIQVVPVLLIMLPSYAIMFPLYFSAIKNSRRGAPPDMVPFFAAFSVVMLLIMFISLAEAVFFIFTYPLIVDRGLSGIDAIKTSFRAATANLGGVLGLVLLMVGLSFLGVLACYVGALFVMPLHYAAWSVAYRQAFAPAPQPPPPPTGF